jgi:hypothetical protein
MLTTRRMLVVVMLSAASGLVSCAPSLEKPETFEWAGGPITFSAPSGGWRREGWDQGGWLGVSFVREHSVGERILVAEQFVIGERDGRDALRELVERFDAMDEGELRRAIELARYRIDDPLSAEETDVAMRVNESLDRAGAAVFAGDRESARREVAGAVRHSQRLHLSLEDVIARVQFRAVDRQEPERWTVRGRGGASVDGEPAIRLDYRFRGPERTYTCRDVYFMRDNHLFMASFLGLDRNLGVFGRVVDSIRFPALARRS